MPIGSLPAGKRRAKMGSPREPSASRSPGGAPAMVSIIREPKVYLVGRQLTDESAWTPSWTSTAWPGRAPARSAPSSWPRPPAASATSPLAGAQDNREYLATSSSPSTAASSSMLSGISSSPVSPAPSPTSWCATRRLRVQPALPALRRRVDGQLRGAGRHRRGRRAARALAAGGRGLAPGLRGAGEG